MIINKNKLKKEEEEEEVRGRRIKEVKRDAMEK